jgi:hypothetical protein
MITTKSRSLLSPPKEAKKYSERFSSTERNIKKKKNTNILNEKGGNCLDGLLQSQSTHHHVIQITTLAPLFSLFSFPFPFPSFSSVIILILLKAQY